MIKRNTSLAYSRVRFFPWKALGRNFVERHKKLRNGKELVEDLEQTKKELVEAMQETLRQKDECLREKEKEIAISSY